MFVKGKPLGSGYNCFTEESGEMMMDSGVYLLESGEEQEFFSETKESAFLLLLGNIKYTWSGNEKAAKRSSLFDEYPICLHVPRGEKVQIQAHERTELLIQKTTNETGFAPVFYDESNVRVQIFGDNVWNNTARRLCRDIFNYGNAPYSNMVLGELITLPGRWSSYPPHHHPQPEIYYYRFDKPQGFGCSYIGDEAFTVHEGDLSLIPGGLCHPQSAAPGYAMYYCWMIRHFPNNPWTQRINDAAHEWLAGEHPQIWEPNI